MGSSSAVGCLADSLSVIYRGLEFESQPGHIAFMESGHEIISIFSLPLIQRWMDKLGFYVPSTVFQSFRDDGMVNMKGSVQ